MDDRNNLILVQKAQNLQRVKLPDDFQFDLGKGPTSFQLNEITMHCDDIGVTHANDLLFDGSISIDPQKMLKINLPFSRSDFIEGRGEGCWAYPLEDVDNDIYESNEIGTVFRIILLNDSEYYPFVFGTKISVVIINEATRPIMQKQWLAEAFDRSDAPFTLEERLDEIDKAK